MTGISLRLMRILANLCFLLYFSIKITIQVMKGKAVNIDYQVYWNYKYSQRSPQHEQKTIILRHPNQEQKFSYDYSTILTPLILNYDILSCLPFLSTHFRFKKEARGLITSLLSCQD